MENRRDSIEHGRSVRSRRGPQKRLTQDQVDAIWELKGKATQQMVADRFGISPPMVRAIYTGKAYGKPPKVNYWKPEEDAKLREMLDRNCTYDEISQSLGRPRGYVAGRAYRLKLRGRESRSV